MVLRLIRALPGDQALLSPLPRVISRNVTPALGRQDHTISPSASCCSSDNTPRPSHPAPNVRDDRDTPLMWARDTRKHRCDLPDNARENVHDGQFVHRAMRTSLSTSLRATGSRECAPDDRLREAIQIFPRIQPALLRRVAPRNDERSLQSSFRGASQRRTMVRNCAPENLEIPGSALTGCPGMTWIAAMPRH